MTIAAMPPGGGAALRARPSTLPVGRTSVGAGHERLGTVSTHAKGVVGPPATERGSVAARSTVTAARPAGGSEENRLAGRPGAPIPVGGRTTPQDHPTRRPNLPSLTGLRFVAAALVVAVHLDDFLPGLEQELQHGQVGVSFFYLLSGFILMWSVAPGDTASRFFRRRAARILPLHLLTWLVAVAVVAPIAGSPDSMAGILLSLVLLQAWIPEGSIAFAANGVSWSLSCEAFFYALFPFAGRVLLRLQARTRRALMAFLGALVVVAALVTPKPGLVFIFPPVRLLEFLIGMLLGLAVIDGWRCPIPLWAALTLAGVATLVTALPGVPNTLTFAAITLIPYSLVIVSAAGQDVERGTSFFARRWLVVLGQWSFALYLSHQLVIRLVAALSGGDGLHMALLVPTLALCIAVSGLLYRYVETPLERWLRPPSRTRAPGSRGTAQHVPGEVRDQAPG